MGDQEDLGQVDPQQQPGPPPPPSGNAVANPNYIPPPPSGSAVPNPSYQSATNEPHNDEIQITHPWYTPTGIAQRAGSVLEGIGEGVFKTAAGVTDIGDKLDHALHPNAPEHSSASNTLHHLAGDDNTPGSSNIYNQMGFGGETLSEFMMGDEALKGLSQSDKLATVAKWMKIAEKSPRLMQALKFGATAAKTGSELTPEETALLRQYPKLAKFVGLGMDAAKAGAVQGAQTTVRTGGDIGQGAKDAAGTAVTAGVLGAATGAASHLLGKGRKAAQTIASMNQIAESAPTRAAVEDQLSGAVNNAFSGETGTLQNSLDDATSTVGMFGEGAPGQQQITAAAKKYATAGKQAVHDAYQGGLDQLVDMAGDSTIPYEGSPLHQAAQALDAEGSSNAGALDQALSVGRPGSAKANRIIDNLLGVGQEAAEDSEAGPEKWVDHNGVEHTEPTTAGAEGEEAVPPEIGMNHLVDYRQKLARLSRDVPPTSPDYHADKAVYKKLLEGIDQTIGKLADGIGDEAGEGAEGIEGEEGEGAQTQDPTEPTPSAGRQHFDAMNEAYRQGIQPFANRDVRNILKGNLNDVAKSIMGGGTSLDDIAAVKKAIGPQNFQQIGKASLQNIVQSFVDKDSGELDYKKLFQKFNKIDPDVRTAMFGDQGSALSKALSVANQASNGLDVIGKQINDLLGSGSIDSILKNPQQAKDIANVVGPDGMKTLGQSILQNQIREASTDSITHAPTKFDPDKVLDWWSSLKDKPEVRDAFFTMDKDTAQHYNQMMSDLAQASSVKKLVKYGVLPVTAGTAGVIHGPGAALFGALAGLGTEAGFGRARDILDVIANSPKTWKALSFAGKTAEKVDKAPVAKAVRNVTAASVYKGLSGSMSGNNAQPDDQPQQ